MRLTAAEVILTSRWEIDSMTIGELLLSQRHWGEVRSRGFLARLGLGEGKTKAVDPRWQVPLEYLRGLQRHGRESLARAVTGPQG